MNRIAMNVTWHATLPSGLTQIILSVMDLFDAK